MANNQFGPVASSFQSDHSQEIAGFLDGGLGDDKLFGVAENNALLGHSDINLLLIENSLDSLNDSHGRATLVDSQSNNIFNDNGEYHRIIAVDLISDELSQAEHDMLTGGAGVNTSSLGIEAGASFGDRFSSRNENLTRIPDRNIASESSLDSLLNNAGGVHARREDYKPTPEPTEPTEPTEPNFP